jgi:hypothetical protein
MSDHQETIDKAVLQFDPWCGDESDVTTLSDRMVVTRVKSVCAICFENILPRDRVRTKVEKWDGKMKTFRFCVNCCAAMARRAFAANEAQEMEIENRYNMGRLRADSKP